MNRELTETWWEAKLLPGRKGDVGRRCCCYERLFYFVEYRSPGYLKGLHSCTLPEGRKKVASWTYGRLISSQKVEERP